MFSSRIGSLLIAFVQRPSWVWTYLCLYLSYDNYWFSTNCLFLTSICGFEWRAAFSWSDSCFLYVLIYYSFTFFPWRLFSSRNFFLISHYHLFLWLKGKSFKFYPIDQNVFIVWHSFSQIELIDYAWNHSAQKTTSDAYNRLGQLFIEIIYTN